MAEFSLRPAQKSDAADLAILDNLSSHGMSHYFWQTLLKGNFSDRGQQSAQALALGRSRLGDENTFYGWRNATIAMDADLQTLGVITGYVLPDHEDEEADDIKRQSPSMVPIFELFDQCIGEWLIDSLAVYPEAQGRGVASSLLDHTLELAQKARNASQASLVVEDNNTIALKLYESRGFVTRDKRPYVKFEGPSKTRNWLLMTVDL